MTRMETVLSETSRRKRAHRKKVLYIVLIAFSCGKPSWLAAQGENYAEIRASKRMEAVRIQERIVVDGRLDEEVWQRAQPAVDFYQQEPDEGELSAFPTEVRFLYDDTTLYVGAMMYDDHPEALIVNELTRDFVGSNSDTFGLVLDLFRDGQTGFGFLTNAGGATRDTQVYDNGSNNANWNGVWYCRTAILENGWSAEYAIPFKTLRFPNQDIQEWGMNMVRWARRANEMSLWSPVLRPQRHYTVSQAGLLTGVQAQSSGTNFRVLPYAKAETEDGLPESDDFSGDAGVDVKWGLTSSLVLDGSYRTDFSQVEADAQQINLTRFSLFFPEKRQFFLESPGSFQIGLTSPGGENRRDLIPFFSRRIGLSSQGQPIPVVGGLRLTGREGSWGIGLLNMQTRDFEQRSGVVRPADNFTAIRMTRDVARGSSLGGFYFGRESDGTVTYNRVAGLDLLTQPTRTLRIEAFGMNSSTDGSPSDWAGRAGFSYEGNLHHAYFFHLHIGDQFRHDLGFVRRPDVGLSFGKYERVFRPETLSQWVREHTFGATLEAVQDSDYQELETRVGGLSYTMGFQDGGSFSVNYDDSYELLTEPFEISDGVVIPIGEYDFAETRVRYQSNVSAPLSGDIQFGSGTFWSGNRKSVNGGLRVRFSEHIAVSGNFERNSVDLPEGAFVTHLGGMNLDWSFTPRMFLNAFVQYNSDTDTWLSNVRFNLIHHPLSDIFVVWNETRGPDTTLRSLIVKYTQMFAF
jgi:hypothetical protein